MCRIEMKTITARDYRYMKNECNYIGRNDHCIKGYLGATNALLPTDRNKMADSIYEQMRAAQTYHNQENSRIGLHLIFEFAPSECQHLDRKKVLGIGYDIAEKEFPNYITYFSVHDNKEHLHLHMMLSTVMLHNGRMYGSGKKGWRCIGYDVHGLLNQFVPEEDIGDLQIYDLDKDEIVYGRKN